MAENVSETVFESPDKDADDVIDLSEREDDEVERHMRYTISSYGADYPADGLVSRIQREDIFVPAFQRKFVWTLAQASRFIESLLLGLPVPGIFLFKEPDTQKFMVVDGQQRLQSLRFFYEGVIRRKEFALRGVTEALSGLTFKTLTEEDRRRLDNSIIHATVFAQEDPEDDRNSVYLMFERLNTGGTPLTPQEIRACVYRGEFNDLLRELATDKGWQTLYGKPNPRGKDQELILRFFALLHDLDSYERPMKTFLNSFMGSNRSLQRINRNALFNEFRKTIDIAVEHLGPASFRPERNLNAALTDALLVGLALRLSRGPLEHPERLEVAHKRLLSSENFNRYYKTGTTDETSIKGRIELAQRKFSEIE